MTSHTPLPSTVLDVVDELAPPGTPLTTPEIAEQFECTTRTIYDKLDRLAEDGRLNTKNVGTDSRVWWQSPPTQKPDERIESKTGLTENNNSERADDDRKDAAARATEATFRQLFEHVPELYLIVEPDDYEIVAVSEAYLEATMTERAEIIGDTLFEVFPADPEDPDPEGVSRLRKSLDRVGSTGKADVMPITYYPIPDRESEDSEFEDRWWSPTNSPVFNEAGGIDYIIHRVEDVTSIVRQLQANGEDELLSRLDTRDSHLATDVMLRGRELHQAKERAHERLRESERKYRTLFESIDEGFCVIEKVETDSDEPIDFRYVEANPAFTEQSGVDNVVGKTMREAIPDISEEWFEVYNTVLQTGEAVRFEREFSSEGRILELYAFRVGERNSKQVGVIFTDITERKETEKALRRSEERYRTLFESIDEGFCIVEMLFDENTDPVDYRIIEANPAFEVLTGLENAEGKTVNELGANIGQEWYERYGNVALSGESIRFEQYVEDWGCWFDVYAFRLGDPQERKVAILFNDITNQRKLQTALERLNTISRELMNAGTQEISTRSTDIARNVLGAEYTALWRYDETTGEFRHVTSHTDPDREGISSALPEGLSEQAWQTFIDNEITVENGDSFTEGTSSELSPQRYILVPLSRHGVICIGSVQAEPFDDSTIGLAGALGSTIEAAWDRAKGEQQLAQQNEELARLNRLNSLIREIDQALVQADSVAEIDRAVCERLAESDQYQFAWIGEHDSTTNTITPREWVGVNSGYIEELKMTINETTTTRNPITTAIRTHDTQVVPDLATETEFAPARTATLERGARSCISVPLVYEESLYGVLSVYATQPQSDERNHAVLTELGQMIGHAINAVETRATLHTDRIVELTLQCREPTTPLCRLAERLGCTVALEGLVHRSEGEPDVFFTVKGSSPETVRAASKQSIAIEELRCIDERDTGSLFRLRSSEPTLSSMLTKQGAVIRTLTIEEGVTTVVVDISDMAAVREFIEQIEQNVPGIELRGRKTRERPLKTQRTFRMVCGERLTGKQEAALQTAYLSGYFQSPRLQTGREVAASLEVSQPTFTNHLRAAQRKICEVLFDAPATSAA